MSLCRVLQVNFVRYGWYLQCRNLGRYRNSTISFRLKYRLYRGCAGHTRENTGFRPVIWYRAETKASKGGLRRRITREVVEAYRNLWKICSLVIADRPNLLSSQFHVCRLLTCSSFYFFLLVFFYFTFCSSPHFSLFFPPWISMYILNLVVWWEVKETIPFVHFLPIQMDMWLVEFALCTILVQF